MHGVSSPPAVGRARATSPAEGLSRELRHLDKLIDTIVAQMDGARDELRDLQEPRRPANGDAQAMRRFRQKRERYEDKKKELIGRIARLNGELKVAYRKIGEIDRALERLSAKEREAAERELDKQRGRLDRAAQGFAAAFNAADGSTALDVAVIPTRVGIYTDGDRQADGTTPAFEIVMRARGDQRELSRWSLSTLDVLPPGEALTERRVTELATGQVRRGDAAEEDRRIHLLRDALFSSQYADGMAPPEVWRQSAASLGMDERELRLRVAGLEPNDERLAALAGDYARSTGSSDAAAAQDFAWRVLVGRQLGEATLLLGDAAAPWRQGIGESAVTQLLAAASAMEPIHHPAALEGTGAELFAARGRITAALAGPPEAAEALQRQIEQALARQPDAAPALADLLRSKAWSAGTEAERLQLATVAAAAGADGIEMLARLARRPERLRDEDARGNTLLDNLERLATRPLHDSLTGAGVTRAKLLDGLLDEVTRPGGAVNQSRYWTCTVTSFQYALARDNPSEYARLVAGLADADGRVVTRGGATLSLERGYFEREHLPGDGRSVSEAIFQSALMEHANREARYDAAKDVNRMPPGGGPVRSYRGQFMLDTDRIGRTLFGDRYRASDNWPIDPDVNRRLANRLRDIDDDALDGGPVVISLVTTGWVTGKPTDEDYGHALTFVRVSGDRVFLRNPWGSGEHDVSALGLRIEDSTTGLVSMPLSEFLVRCNGVSLPAALA